jgi:hypothetical protein
VRCSQGHDELAVIFDDGYRPRRSDSNESFEHVRRLSEAHDHLTGAELKPGSFPASTANASRSSILSAAFSNPGRCFSYYRLRPCL